MTETLHWYAETSGGVQTGNCTVTENGGALHLTADLPAGTLKAVRAELPWKMAADELTDICVSAEDVVRFLPHAIRSLSSEGGR